VHSSTSSFKPIPRAWASLALALTVAVGVLGGLEVFWRARGFVPTLEDAAPLWCAANKRATGDAVAIVGSSRLQTSIDPVLMSSALGGRTVTQLAVAGASPIPVLLALADDPGYSGTVLLEYMPRRFLTADSGASARMETFIEACRDPSLVAPIEARLDQFVQQHLVVTESGLQLFGVLSHLSRNHALPREMRQTLREDRFLAMIASAVPAKMHPDVWEPALSEEALATRLATMRAAIAKIRARGGQVVLYRPIATGDVLADEEGRFPTTIWLPRVGRALDVPVIDFTTIAALREIRPQDGEHTEVDDAPVITRAIVEKLVAITTQRQ
jgi:hypothetical protein